MRKFSILAILFLAVAPYVWAATTRTITADVLKTTSGVSLTLPTTTGTTGQYLQTNGSGTTSWQTVSSSGSTATTQLGVNNLGLSSSVASGALTINLTQNDGTTNPSTGANAVSIPFPNAFSTTTGSTWTTQTVTSALNIVVPNGATLGLTNGVNNYLWVFAEYDTSNAAVQLCVSGTPYPDGTSFFSWPSSGTAYYPFISSSATNGYGMYCTNTPAQTGTVRLIGRVLTSTAGAWSSNPLQIVTMPTPVRADSNWICGNLVPQGTTTNPTLSSTKTIAIVCGKREGRYLIAEYQYNQTANTGAAAGSGDYYFPLPTTWTGGNIDFAYVGQITNGTPLGTPTFYSTTPAILTGTGLTNAILDSTGYISQGTTSNGPCVAFANSASTFKLLCDNGFTSRTVLSSSNATYNFAISGQFSLKMTIRVPIVGWTEFGPLF